MSETAFDYVRDVAVANMPGTTCSLFFCLGLSTYTATLSTLTVADLVFVVPSLAHTWAVLLGETRVGVTFCLQRYVRAELLSIHGRAT